MPAKPFLTGQRTVSLSVIVCLILILTSCGQNPHKYSRGVGIYPGDPAEDFSPDLVSDNNNYRNIACMRAAYNSSSYDYNLVAQLVTDGIIENEMPSYISVSTNKGEIPRNGREWLLDQNSVTQTDLDGSDVWIQYELNREATPAGVDKITLQGTLDYNEKASQGWQFICSGSDDGVKWNELSKITGSGLPGKEIPNPFAAFLKTAVTPGKKAKPASSVTTSEADSTTPRPSFTFSFSKPVPQRIIDQVFVFKKQAAYHFYRISMSSKCAVKWVIGDMDFLSGDARLNMVPSYQFKSAWMSAGNGQEWVYIDLGSSGTFDRIKLYWINKAIQGSIQVSEDAKNWNDLVLLPGDQNHGDDILLKQLAKGRYVKILMKKSASGGRYVLSEVEIFGKGGLVPEPKPNPVIKENKLYLAGGNWKIRRASLVSSTGEEISHPDFKNDDWTVATVPGTALVSYWNAGALPNPNFGDNQMMISESFFNSDFWYRDNFEVPAGFKNEHMFLNFDGINWKADVFVNGSKAGNIEGAFIRGRFDVTDLIRPGHKNAIAVLIHKDDHIGVVKEATALYHDKNGGVLGADNPTYHASIGWDWIPTIRGRNIGIWNDVYLNTSGNVTIENPLVYSELPLPDTTAADINIELVLKNHKEEPVSGILTAEFGNIKVNEKVSLGPSELKTMKLNKSVFPGLHLKNPNLWWPKGYGAQFLYDVRLTFKTRDGNISDDIDLSQESAS